MIPPITPPTTTVALRVEHIDKDVRSPIVTNDMLTSEALHTRGVGGVWGVDRGTIPRDVIMVARGFIIPSAFLRLVGERVKCSKSNTMLTLKV